jgi:hypothetical protein
VRRACTLFKVAQSALSYQSRKLGKDASVPIRRAIAALAADESGSLTTELAAAFEALSTSTAAAPSTACSGADLLPHSGNDLTPLFELRLIDLAAGEALGQDFQCGR